MFPFYPKPSEAVFDGQEREKKGTASGNVTLTTINTTSNSMTIERLHLMFTPRHTVQHRRQLLLSTDRRTVPNDRRVWQIECGYEVGPLWRV